MMQLHDILNIPPKQLPLSPKDKACYPAAIAFGLTVMGRRTTVAEIDKVMNRRSEQYISFLEQIRCMGWLAQQGYHIRHVFDGVKPYREWLGPKTTLSVEQVRQRAIRAGVPKGIVESDFSDRRVESARLFFAKGGPLAGSRYTEEAGRLKQSFLTNWLRSPRSACAVLALEIGYEDTVHAVTLAGYRQSQSGEPLTALFKPMPRQSQLIAQDISWLMRTGQVAEGMNHLFIRR